MTRRTLERSAVRTFTIAMLLLFGMAKAGCDYAMVEAPAVTPGLKISVSPQAAELQRGTSIDLAATISGFKNDGAVSWSFFGQQAGDLKVSGLTASYTAPTVLTSSPLQVTIRVRSNEDTSRYAQAILTIVDSVTNGGGNGGGQQVSITINPLSATIAPGATQQFTAAVSGDVNTDVTWRLISGPGTLSNTGLYTAPATINGTQTAVIEATSVADPSQTIRATVTIKQPFDPNMVCFSRDIMPIFASNCAMADGCHRGSNPPEGLNFTTYEGILAGFDHEDEGENEILEKIQEDREDKRMPPPPYPRLQQSQIDLIKKWISQGAKNTDCSEDTGGDCDTLNMSFATHVKPIIQNNCMGCHSASSPKGVNLKDYAGVKAAVQTGQFLGAITHAPGFIPMPDAVPRGSMKLDDCSIAKIRSWIRDGAPNN